MYVYETYMLTYIYTSTYMFRWHSGKICRMGQQHFQRLPEEKFQLVNLHVLQLKIKYTYYRLIGLDSEFFILSHSNLHKFEKRKSFVRLHGQCSLWF